MPRGSAQRRCVAAPAATASATLASEPARGVWQMLGGGHWLTVASVSRGVRAAYTRELLSVGGGSGPNCNLKWLTRTAISAALQSDAAFRMALDIRAGAPDPILAGVNASLAYGRIHDGALALLLSSSARARVALGRAALSCVTIQEAMAAQLMVDAHVLLGAAERGCVAALDQWCLCLSYRASWRVQRTWALPAAALRAIRERERPEAIRVLRWVFDAASPEGSVVAGTAAGEVRLPPLLLTVLAFQCTRAGHFETFRWLSTRGRHVTGQDIAPRVSAADLEAFDKQVVTPRGAAARADEMSFMKLPNARATHTLTLMDHAILYGQAGFVEALAGFSIAPALSCFSNDSARLAASKASCRLLQWLHAQPACPFDAVSIIQMSLTSCIDAPPGAAVDAGALEKLAWLRSIGAFEALAQHDLNYLVAFAAVGFTELPRYAHPVVRARVRWLLQDMGAEWPGGGAAHVVRVCTFTDASVVVRMVSEFACPWGRWTSAECALVRGRQQQRRQQQQQRQQQQHSEDVQRCMLQLHALGCPCACARTEGA
eukprot:TRINITY_DN4867_c0_g1_i1.p1 TRINITY_DN4867_c0_g1~~TRINITY_DN4867_c0_g1_i1.p1  ORF type:complete len:545 (-),score=151.70 TRINITY_DN4867_c0_g1_i1:488-2122(-)